MEELASKEQLHQDVGEMEGSLVLVVVVLVVGVWQIFGSSPSMMPKANGRVDCWKGWNN